MNDKREEHLLKRVLTYLVCLGILLACLCPLCPQAFAVDTDDSDFVIDFWDLIKPKYTLGDVNGDGVIDSLDGLLLMRYLNGWDVEIASPKAMDVNNDGVVDSLDGLLLMRFLNGWDVTLG